MKFDKIENMKLGFFIGNFYPSIYKTDTVEIAIKHFNLGYLDGGYCRKIDTEIYVVLSGKVEFNGNVYKEGSIVKYEPGDVKYIFAIEDSECLVVKFPGTKDDKHYEESLNLEIIHKMFNNLINKVMKFPERAKPVNTIDVSVVVQGAIDRSLTIASLLSIRRTLPGATIILSTWEGSNVEGLDYDEVVFCKDPGTCECNIQKEYPIKNNGNRQLYSTQEGLKRVKTEYVLKMRSDLAILGDDILSYINAFPKRTEEYKMFNSRVIIGELFTRHNFHFHTQGDWHQVPKIFHPSDWFMFGKTEDIRMYFENTPLMPIEDMGNYSLKYPERCKDTCYPWSWRYATEQYYCYEAFKRKYPEITFEDWTDWDDEKIQISEKFIKNNFIILNMTQHKICNLKYINACFTNIGIRNQEKDLMDNQEFLDYYNHLV